MPETHTTLENCPSPPPARALIILVLGLLAAWLAAGSLGWLAPPFEKALTWLALATIVIAATAGRRLISNDGLLLGGATLIALLLTASSLPVVNILAVAIVLAAVAHVRPGSTAQVAGAAALAATTLAVFRLACDGSAAAWTVTNTIGHVEGLWAGWLTGRPLLIGASFGGLDFLVLMAALTSAWLMAAPGPRIARAAWAILFIFLAQTAYLVVLAFSDDLAGLLPQTMPKFDDGSHLGIWTWGNAIRGLLPWNLPLLAAVLQCMVAVGIFRLTAWPENLPSTSGSGSGAKLPSASGSGSGAKLPSASGSGSGAKLPSASGSGAGAKPPSPSGRGAGGEGWLTYAPAGLLFVAVVAMIFSPVKPDLRGRRIVAYDDGATDWSTSDTGAAPHYGLLPALVESLGGQFLRSRDLADAVLQEADVLIVLPPRTADSSAGENATIPDDVRNRIWSYVAAGGRMIVAGEPETSLSGEENVLNAFLEPTAMSFRDDTADSLTEHWEDNLQSAPHAATASSDPGRGPFSLDRPASIRVRWPAGPLLVGRWAWNEVGTDPDRPEALAYLPGERLGDLVLTAQQNVGRGTVVVLDAAACMGNEGIPFSYTFTGPLLASLAAHQAAPLAWWRQLLGLAAAGAAMVLLFRSFQSSPAGGLRHTLGLAAATVVFALAMMACHRLSNTASQLLPLGTKTADRPVIYVDGSHVEAMGKDPRGENGIGRFMHVLTVSGYLPLVAPDLSPQRLGRAAMLISIAPAQAFSRGEIAAVEQFVQEGGVFLSMVGSPDAGPSRALLDQLQLHVSPAPLPPWVHRPETEPLGRYLYPNKQQPSVQFYAAWPVASDIPGEIWPKDDPDGKIVIAGHGIGRGQAFILGDTGFALKKNLDSFPQNAVFWRDTLRNWLGRQEDTTITAPKPKG